MLISIKTQKILTLIVFVTMFILGLTGWDYQISAAFAFSQSSFGKFIRDYGELPGWTVMLMASLLLLKNMQKLRIYQVALTVLVMVITGFAHLNILGLWPAVIYIIILIQVLLYLEKRIDMQYPSVPLYQRFSKPTIFMGILGPGLITGLMKLLWGRVRYRDLGNVTEFTQWYQIKGVTGNYSFPSGHAAMGTMVFPLIIIFAHLPEKRRKIIQIGLLLWAVIVALGRIKIGAHYTTDVLFSLWLGIILFNYLNNRMVVPLQVDSDGE